MDDEAVVEIFREFGPVRIRRMFGGRGIYRGDLMFALESEGAIYLKADSTSAAQFKALGSRPFGYVGRNGKPMTMNYWSMPDAALDEPDEASRLARLALEAAQRAKAGKRSPV